MKTVLVATVVFVLLVAGCGGDSSPSPAARSEEERIDAWVEEFCGVLIDYSNEITALPRVDPIGYLETIGRISGRHAERIAAIDDVGATREYQKTAADGLDGLARTLTESIPRIRAAMAGQDRAAIDAEQRKLTAAIESVTQLTESGLKKLPSRAVAAMNLIPGCTRPNELVPADATGKVTGNM